MYPHKEDCFAHTTNGRCNALKVMLCSTKGNCPFYQKETGELNRMRIEHDIIEYGAIRCKGVNSYG